jgi:CRISPR-associated endonuclease/helicase Cas3
MSSEFVEHSPWVEFGFPVQGDELPTDHGYALYGALSRLVPTLHERSAWSVLPVRGLSMGLPVLRLGKESRVAFRLPAAEVAPLLALAGKEIEVEGHTLRLGIPQMALLEPSATLASRYVTIKGYMEPEPFKAALERELAELLGEQHAVAVKVGPRRVVRVSAHMVVGFQVTLTGLSDDESLAVQATGLGGRRKMGAGIFFAKESL